MDSIVVDVHTHNYSENWLNLLREHGKPRYEVKQVAGGREAIHHDGAAFNTIFPAFFDFDARVKAMNEHGVDICVVSLAAPSVYWGTPEISLKAAQAMNNDFAAAQTAHPDRIRWFATLPWQHPELAKPELERALKLGASGVLVLANVGEKSLTDPLFAPTWKAIDDHALPVLIHPTAPPAVHGLDMQKYMLIVPIGFMFDTTLALGRMIYDGFFDRYTKLKIIGAHGGGALPFLISRFDRCHEKIDSARATISKRPSTYMGRLFLDSVVYSREALQMAINCVGEDNVLYGSDFPHNISDMGGILARVNELPGSVRHKVRGNNAERIFNLKL
ncbi:amidohydrolase family protein [Paraburkholderia fungorum]|uniref:amidohydrolase family protein n=1 Tax=Paraburkholderia fungorum TaxID=134537 RepID=UPI0038BAE005